MGDFTSLTRANATAIIRYAVDGVPCEALIWTPDNPHGSGHVSGYRAPTAGGKDGWAVTFFAQGGAGINQRAQDLNTNSTALKLINGHSSVIVSYDTVPLGFYLDAASDPRAKLIPDTFGDDAALIMHIRAHAWDSDYFGAGNGVSVLPELSLHWGSSEGGTSAARTQLHRDGDFEYEPDPVYGQAEHRFARRHTHCCKFVLVNQLQVCRASMVMSKFSAAVQARADDVLEPPLSTYTANGAHAAGVSTLNVTGDTVALIRGNRLLIGSYSYAVDADYAGGAGAVSIVPSLRVALSGGETVDIDETALEKYGTTNQAWGQYDYLVGDGYIWQDDLELDDPDAVYSWELKRQNDVDLMVTSDNPRVTETVWILIGSSANEEITSELTGEQSFKAHAYAPVGTLADGATSALDNNLHGEKHAFILAEALYLAGNTEHVYLYVGNTTSNPNSTLAENGGRAWNKGQNADFSATVLSTILTAEGFG